jgi:hypothetical protein
VELCGLPGSGKSTLAESLVEVLATAGVEVAVLDLPVSARVARRVRATRRLAGAAAAAGRWPVRSARAARWFAAGDQSASDAAAAWVQWLALQRLVHRARRGGGVHLLEEGAVQTLWTALLRAHRPPPAELAWELVPPSARSDLVLLVDVPVETAATRLEGRRSAHSRTQRLAPAERRAELTQGRGLLEQLLAGCPVPVLRVESGDDRTREQTALSAAGLLADLVADRSVGSR